MTNETKTTVEETDIDIDALLGTPGADNVMTPANTETEKKHSLFSREAKVDLTFIDKPDDKKDASSQQAASTEGADNQTGADKKTETVTKDEFENILNSTETTTETEEATKKSGRAGGLVELTTKLIEKGLLVPFEGEEDVSKYTLKDFEDLFEMNNKQKDDKTKEEVSNSFFKGLPEELQVAAHYVANGGTDLKNLFRSLAAHEEIKSLELTDEDSQEQIVRSYMHAKRIGTAEEIEAEIEDLRDRGKLEARAIQYKPKLDLMQEEIIARQVQEQELIRKQHMEQARAYSDNIYKALEPGELNGLKLDKKIQSELYGGLTQANYPSMSGRPTNLLGHLLEKYQYQEPNHALISEALWLLKDPEGYRSKVREGGKKDSDTETARKLKTEQANKTASSTATDESDNKGKKTPGVQRPSGNNFFKRSF